LRCGWKGSKVARGAPWGAREEYAIAGYVLEPSRTLKVAHRGLAGSVSHPRPTPVALGIPAPAGVIWWNHESTSTTSSNEPRPDYREVYANSVQIRVSVWDFQLVFGLAASDAPDQVTIRNQSAIFLSPQQAKALWNVLGQNLAQYEQAFGVLNLEPQNHGFPQGPIN